MLDDGQTIETENIISSAGTLETLRLLGGDDRPAPVEAGNITYTESIYSLDRQPSELGHDATIVFYNDSPKFTYEMPNDPIDVRSGIICSPNNFEYGRPPEEGRIRITALANPAHWLNLPPEQYDREKNYWGERLLESALRVIPDFRHAIVDTDFFTRAPSANSPAISTAACTEPRKKCPTAARTWKTCICAATTRVSWGSSAP